MSSCSINDNHFRQNSSPGVYLLSSGLLPLHAIRHVRRPYAEGSSIQNAAARLVTGAGRCDHIMPALRQLHWLPVCQWVEYKVACLVHQSLAGQTPAYIADDIQLITDNDRHQLRSAVARTCLVPRTCNNFGDRSFSAVGPRMCNSSPLHLQRDMNFVRFKHQLKHFYSGVSQPRHIVTVIFAP